MPFLFPFEGCHVEVLSTLGVRYQGVLKSVDGENKSVTLTNVHHFGSETRVVEGVAPITAKGALPADEERLIYAIYISGISLTSFLDDGGKQRPVDAVVAKRKNPTAAHEALDGSIRKCARKRRRKAAAVQEGRRRKQKKRHRRAAALTEESGKKPKKKKGIRRIRSTKGGIGEPTHHFSAQRHPAYFNEIEHRLPDFEIEHRLPDFAVTEEEVAVADYGPDAAVTKTEKRTTRVTRRGKQKAATKVRFGIPSLAEVLRRRAESDLSLYANELDRPPSDGDASDSVVTAEREVNVAHYAECGVLNTAETVKRVRFDIPSLAEVLRRRDESDLSLYANELDRPPSGGDASDSAVTADYEECGVLDTAEMRKMAKSVRFDIPSLAEALRRGIEPADKPVYFIAQRVFTMALGVLLNGDEHPRAPIFVGIRCTGPVGGKRVCLGQKWRLPAPPTAAYRVIYPNRSIAPRFDDAGEMAVDAELRSNGGMELVGAQPIERREGIIVHQWQALERNEYGARQNNTYVEVAAKGTVGRISLGKGHFEGTHVEFLALAEGDSVEVDLMRLEEGCWVGPNYLLPNIYCDADQQSELRGKMRAMRAHRGDYLPVAIREPPQQTNK